MRLFLLIGILFVSSCAPQNNTPHSLSDAAVSHGYAIMNRERSVEQNRSDQRICFNPQSDDAYLECMRERGYIVYKDGVYFYPPPPPGLSWPSETSEQALQSIDPSFCRFQSLGSARRFFECTEELRRSGFIEAAAKEQSSSRTSENLSSAPPSAQAPHEAEAPMVPSPSTQNSFVQTSIDEGWSALKFCTFTKIIVWREDVGHCLAVHWLAGMAYAYTKDYIKTEICQDPDIRERLSDIDARYNTGITTAICSA